METKNVESSRTTNKESINKSARFLTYQEVQTACGTNIQTSGDLDDCIYLMENTGFDNGGIQDA